MAGAPNLMGFSVAHAGHCSWDDATPCTACELLCSHRLLVSLQDILKQVNAERELVFLVYPQDQGVFAVDQYERACSPPL